MEQEVGVADLVHAAVAEEATHVFLQLLATLEGVSDFLDQILLSHRQAIGIFRVDRGEVRIGQWVCLALDRHCALLQIQLVEQQAISHLKLRTTTDDLPL